MEWNGMELDGELQRERERDGMRETIEAETQKNTHTHTHTHTHVEHIKYEINNQSPIQSLFLGLQCKKVGGMGAQRGKMGVR